MGTVGVPVTAIEARLQSVPDMGYDALAEVPRGEICLRGDIGEWQPNGTMKIIDRKKNIFKLSQGDFESFMVAVVIPERKALEDWASMHNEGGYFESLCRNPKARK
ncbi:hypothetical protein ACLOJK_023802 [Asimina triloba]